MHLMRYLHHCYVTRTAEKELVGAGQNEIKAQLTFRA